jgi:hypothetical protein
MSEQTQATTKTTKKRATKPKAEKKAKATKAKEREAELVVFAFRLTPAERDAIHKTAGPARASRYVRAVAAAFAAEDTEAFKGVIKEAREARA